MKKVLFFPMILLFIAGCASHKPNHTKHVNQESHFTSETSLHFSYTGPEVISFAGLANYDDLNAGGSEGVMYPGGHPAVFLVSVLAHAGTVEAIKESRRNAIEESANEVLLPYSSFLNQFTYQPLFERAAKSLIDLESGSHHSGFVEDVSAVESGRWVMQSAPQFFMLQDSGALVLQNAIALYENAEKPKIVYRNVIEVISLPYQGDDPEQFWMEGGGERIANLSHELLIDSINIAIDDALKTQVEEAKQQTFRFYQEGKKTYERGSLIAAQYDRITIRTLRGWIKSVPIISEENQYFDDYDEDQAIASIVRGIGVYY